MEEHLALGPIAMLLIGAVLGGLLFAGLRQPPLVGYIIAGAVLGPSGLQLITDRPTINSFAELGVLVLLFVVGMHLSLRAFKSIWRTALGATVFQILVSLSVVMTIGHALGWAPGRSVLLGFVLALSSTAVGIKMLEDIGELRNATGRCVVGVLIAQDLAVVPMLIIVVALGAGEGVDIVGLVLKLSLAGLALVGLIWALSRRQRIHLPFRRLLIRYPDLAPVVGLTLCLLGAAGTAALDLSAGLGAFLAGLYVGNTTERPLMVRALEPVHSLLLMMFFLSIGLLIDFEFLLENLYVVLLLVALVFLVNSAINVAALRSVGEPWRVAFIAAFALAQIGEFSFVLSAAGASSGLITGDASRLVVAVIAISMLASPLWLELARRLHALRAAPPESVMRLLARLYRDEARLLRLRSKRALQGGTGLASSIGDGIDRVLQRKDDDPAPAATQPAPPDGREAKRSG
jgi:CPA2 family monovalent cation:H+ antiporter-2